MEELKNGETVVIGLRDKSDRGYLELIKRREQEQGMRGFETRNLAVREYLGGGRRPTLVAIRQKNQD